MQVTGYQSKAICGGLLRCEYKFCVENRKCLNDHLDNRVIINPEPKKEIKTQIKPKSAAFIKVLLNSDKTPTKEKLIMQSPIDFWERTDIRNPKKLRVLVRDNYICQNPKCMATTRLTVDHIIPQVKGGSNKMINLQTLCYDCNQDKADNMPE